VSRSRNIKSVACRFYPSCNLGDKCSFLHSDLNQPEACQWYPDCKYGSKCRYYHPTPLPATVPSFPLFDWSQCPAGQKRFLVAGVTLEGKASVLNSLHNYLSNNSLSEAEAALPKQRPSTRGLRKGAFKQRVEYLYSHPDAEDTTIALIDAAEIVNFEDTQKVSFFSDLFSPPSLPFS
jgi:hypothetical protein